MWCGPRRSPRSAEQPAKAPHVREASFVNAARISQLQELLNFTRPAADVVRHLSAFGWDADKELVVLEAAHVTAVLDRYLSGELDGRAVEDWANAIECRDDIGISDDSPVAAVLHALANPTLTSPLTRQFVTECVSVLAVLQTDSN